MNSSLIEKNQISKGKVAFTFKIIVLGDAAVGKTSIVKRFVNNVFDRNYKPTFGLDVSIKDIKVNNYDVRLQLWDVSGHKELKNIRKRFYTGTQGAILLYDVTRASTLENLEFWTQELIENSGETPFAVVGNKIDLTQLVAVDNLKEIFSGEHESLIHVRTSALTGENVERVFQLITNKILSEK